MQDTYRQIYLTTWINWPTLSVLVKCKNISLTIGLMANMTLNTQKNAAKISQRVMGLKIMAHTVFKCTIMFLILNLTCELGNVYIDKFKIYNVICIARQSLKV